LIKSNKIAVTSNLHLSGRGHWDKICEYE